VKTHFPPKVVYECAEGDYCGRYGPPRPDEKKGGFTRKDHYLQHRRDVHMIGIPKGRGSGKTVNARPMQIGDESRR
jgi:hypothetical protein